MSQSLSSSVALGRQQDETKDEMKESVVGREVVIDLRLEPENSSGNSVAELTAKENSGEK